MTTCRHCGNPHPDGMNQTKIIHILRNPYGFSQEDIKRIRLQAADLLEEWPKLYREAVKKLKPYCMHLSDCLLGTPILDCGNIINEMGCTCGLDEALGGS